MALDLPVATAAGLIHWAHGPNPAAYVGGELRTRADREGTSEPAPLAPGATAAQGAGRRGVDEEPDALRTCFERDLDRIQHSRAFRRLAGKCQVFIDPDDDHLRTRLTHAIEVCQVAVSIARPVGLNVALTAAAATGHDCGHGPAGHASEGALSPFLPGGYHHAVYGADVVLEPLNLCVETLDAVRNHSWNRPAPATPEGEVVAWADRIAYVCHDFEDAVSAGIVTPADLPAAVAEIVGRTRRGQLHCFITAMVETIAETGVVAMRATEAEALAAFRQFNYERIYLRPESVEQADRAARLIAGLTDFYASHPGELPRGGDGPQRTGLVAGSPDATAEAVRYVSGMTDRFAHTAAVDLLGWAEAALPRTA
jgi:dGTPase